MQSHPEDHHADSASPERRPPIGGIRLSKLMLVGGTASDLEALDRAVEGCATACSHAQDLREARERAEQDEIDIVLIDADKWRDGALELARWIATSDRPTRAVLFTASPSLELAVEAMRSGAADLLISPFDVADVAPRIAGARAQAERSRDNARKVERLKRICRRLSNSRQQAAHQVDELCDDLASAYKELADQMGQVTLSTEFTALVRQELDVESLLRTTLEFLLTKTGPTNAAVFLPTGNDDFSLGAYVNYDLPQDTGEVLLDHLADALPARLESVAEVRLLDSPGLLGELLGTAATWLAAHNMIAFACHDSDGTCLAVVCVFRDGAQPFSRSILPRLELIRDLFAEQLGRIIRLHNRHKHDATWSGFDVAGGGQPEDLEEGEDWGMAA